MSIRLIVVSLLISAASGHKKNTKQNSSTSNLILSCVFTLVIANRCHPVLLSLPRVSKGRGSGLEGNWDFHSLSG